MAKKITYILIISFGLFATSCDKYLTLEPQDGIVRQDFWKTKEQLKSAVNGCYASLLADPLVADLFIWGELRGDMLATGTGAKVDDLNIINVNISSSNTLTDWSVLYKTINNCNTVIDFGPDVMKNDNTLTQATLNSYLGEALALRSLMYFYLARTFGDVPLKLKSTSSDDDDVQLAKSTQKDVLNQIITDLKTAEQYLPTSYGSRDADKGRITRYAVYAMLADVYLWMDQYDSSIEACDKIINSNQFGLVAGDNSWFTTVYYQGNSNESIFEIQFNQNKANPFYAMLAASSKRFKAAVRVTDEVYTVDNINIANKDIRGDGASLKFSDGAIWKYQGINASSSRGSSSSSSYAHWFVYRYPDVMLMKAEALNQLNKGQQALDIIATIRLRANALPATEKVLLPSDKEGITNYILDERAREFAFEGKRWFDLLRNAKRNNYARLDLLTDVVLSTAAAENQQSAIVKYRDTRSHYLPIYMYELQTNKNLVQNPFYQ